MRSSLHELAEWTLIAIALVSPDKRYEGYAGEDTKALAEQIVQGTTLSELRASHAYIPEGKWEFIATTMKYMLRGGSDVIDTEWAKNVERLDAEARKEQAVRTLSEVKALIVQDKIDEAELMLGSITIGKAGKLINTADLMISSLTDGEAFMTNISEFDQCGGLYTGNLMAITGETGSMKTAISLWMVLQILTVNPTFTAMYFEKEMPVKDIARRLVSNMTRVTASDIKRAMAKNKDGDSSDIDKIQALIQHGFDNDADKVFSRLSIVAPTEFGSATDMMRIIKQHKPNVWVLDFATSLTEDSPSDDMYLFMKNQLDVLKKVTHDTNSFGIILAQAKQNVTTERSNKILMLGDIEFSSRMNQYCAYIYTCFFPKNYYTANYVNQNYFYLIKRKGREEMPEMISMLAKPEVAEFRSPGDLLTEMKKWIGAYMSKHNKG